MVLPSGAAPRPAGASFIPITSDTSRIPAPASGVPKASDKRRAQNRAAQKTYREKRKRRLQELEQLAKTAGLVDGDIMTTGKRDGAERGGENHSSSSGSAQGSPDGVFALPLRQSPVLQNATLPAQDDHRVFELDGLLDDNSWLDNTMPFPDIAGNDLVWPVVGDFSGSSLYAQSSSTTLARSKSLRGGSGSPGSSSVSSFDQAIEQVLNPPANWQPEIRNNMIFHQTLRWAAFFEIAGYLGIPIDHCEVEENSRFYRPINPASEDSDKLVLAVKDSYASLARDLRPTKLQITRQHAAYIDILPWPDMRDKLIELTTADPPLFDDDELWADIEADGLVCWGNMQGGNKQNLLSGGGAPCDARSWEAKTWFLAKWSWIIGGDDSELARNSAWWRAMRGVGQGFSFG